MKNNYESILESLSLSLSELHKQMYSGVVDLIKNFSELYLSFFKNTFVVDFKVSPEREKELQQFCEKLLKYGWVIFDNLPIFICNMEFDSQEAVDTYIEEFFTDEYLHKIFDLLMSNPNISKEDIESILKCMELKLYKACCCLLIANLEHYVINNYEISQKAIIKEDAIDRMENLNKKVNGDSRNILSYLHIYSLVLGIRELFKSVGDMKNVDDTTFVVPNRHCLMHGYSKRKYTKKDCYFLLLLLSGFIIQKERLFLSKQNV